MGKFQLDVPVTQNIPVAEETYALTFHCPELAAQVLPGQFINIRVHGGMDPLLRRPYSVSNVQGDDCEILYTVVGKGTALLAGKRAGDTINILGPLGNSFGYNQPFRTALIVAGGIGIAPFPLLCTELYKAGKTVHFFAGARSSNRIVRRGFPRMEIATDDGSEGFMGTVVGCMRSFLAEHPVEQPMIFACGPNAMLRAVQQLAAETGIRCELSLESEMACGIGICQGCPVERAAGERKYALVCTEGPCFNSGDIRFDTHA